MSDVSSFATLLRLFSRGTDRKEPKLETDGLVRAVDGIVDGVVDGVDLRVHEGEVVAVIGSSGAGKSPSLRLLDRLDEPTGGTVYLDGVGCREPDPQELRQRVCLVPQGAALRPGTVFENVTVSPRLRGDPLDEGRVTALLDRVDLPGYGDRDVDDLSGGERQRVAVARPLYVDPEVLRLDEPTAHLDEETEARVEDLLTDLIREDDPTCVLVTHDAAQAERLGDRVVEFEAGRVVDRGTP